MVSGEKDVASVAATHVAALDAQIRSLKVTRAVLSTVARRGSTTEEMTLMNRLARLSAAERRRVLEEFVDEMFHGLDTADPVVRDRMREMAVDLPDDPTSEQVDAWVELAELIQDPRFRARMRRVAEFNAAGRGPETPAGASSPGTPDVECERRGHPLPRVAVRREGPRARVGVPRGVRVGGRRTGGVRGRLI